MNPQSQFLRITVLVATFTATGVVVVRGAGTSHGDSIWTDPKKAAAEDSDFLVQGEYLSDGDPATWGLQVVALGDGNFDAYLLEGGLPGAGWKTGGRRIPLSGIRTEAVVRADSADGVWSAELIDGAALISRGDEMFARMLRAKRASPTLAAKPPDGAIVLFDGSSADAWVDGRLEDGLLCNTDVSTRQRFHDYTLHLEFRTPYKPYARKQQRGNSGVYHQGRYETQVLDSFGLTGEANECGGIYSIAAPRLNACLPPLTWQTYDVDFTAARFDENDELVNPARITVRLNGILIHNNQELPATTTAAPLKTVSPEPGPIFLQHHKNPVYYRNIWIVRK